tara:strand:- start:362 stop:499 length:138 start_codon:yes stop_codon:yes gene_type:complete
MRRRRKKKKWVQELDEGRYGLVWKLAQTGELIGVGGGEIVAVIQV